ncbi:hypothetical protein CBS9595_003186 [Malassezia furfur]|nr:hypothetical protein CBS9595_003186 [Malassezia furfur]
MTTLDARLADAAQIAAVNERGDAYERILDEALHLHGDELRAALAAYVHAAVLDRANLVGAGLIVARRSLAALCARIRDAHTRTPGGKDDAAYLATLEHILTSTGEQTVALDDELTDVRILAADLLEAQHRWADAMRMLQDSTSDAGRRSRSDAHTFELNVRLLRLCLQCDALAEADLYHKRASALVHTVQRSSENEALAPVLLAFRPSQAELYDRQLRFTDAALRFYELSTAPTLDDAQKTALLSKSVAAALLAPISAQRSRLLAQLQRDPRTAALPLGTALQHVAARRLVRAPLVAHIAAHLAPHQLTRVPGSDHTLLDAAMVEHNIDATSRVYDTITLDSLAALVGLPEPACETMVAHMILQHRLPSTCFLDQMAHAVHFGPPDEPSGDEAPSEAPAPEASAADVEAPMADADAALRQGRDRRIGAALAYLSDAHAALQMAQEGHARV